MPAGEQNGYKVVYGVNVAWWWKTGAKVCMTGLQQRHQYARRSATCVRRQAAAAAAAGQWCIR